MKKLTISIIVVVVSVMFLLYDTAIAAIDDKINKSNISNKSNVNTLHKDGNLKLSTPADEILPQKDIQPSSKSVNQKK